MKTTKKKGKPDGRPAPEKAGLEAFYMDPILVEEGFFKDKRDYVQKMSKKVAALHKKAENDPVLKKILG